MSADNTEPVLLSGGNPQIAKGDGNAPVAAYLNAMPGWKQDVGRKLDDLIRAAVPDVELAVRWNSPLYGIEGNGWFASYRCFTRYVKLTFFRGSLLDPAPSLRAKDEHARFVHIAEGEEVDERQLLDWFRQASLNAGWDGS